MQSMPHSTAARIASSPWQWAATFRPARWASSAMAASSSVGVLPGAGRAGVGHHAARRADLDDLGAVLDLVADGLADLGHAVGDALLDGQRQDVGGEGLEHGGVEVAAGGADGVAGGHDAGAVDPAHVDGLHEGDVEQEPTGLHEQPEVAHGREAGPQGAAGVGHRPQGPQRRVLLHGDRAGWRGRARP